MPSPAIIPLKPTLTMALASTMMIVVCAVVTTALAAVALMRMQRTTTRQQRLKMDLACTAKRTTTQHRKTRSMQGLHQQSAPLVRIQTVQGTSLLMDTSGLMTFYRCCLCTTHPALYVGMELLRMVNAVMMAMTSKRMDAMPVSAKEVLRTSEVAVLVP